MFYLKITKQVSLKKLLIGVVVIAFALSLIPFNANAQIPPGGAVINAVFANQISQPGLFGSTIVDKFAATIIRQTNAILFAIFTLLGLALRLSAMLFGVFLFVSLQPLANFNAVVAGWNITREIVNLAFLLIWTVMAIGTILRIPGWGARELLGRLIGIALLVNFSFVIAEFLIDIANVFGAQFLAATNQGNFDLTSFASIWQWSNGMTRTLMSGFDIVALTEPSQGLLSRFLEFATGDVTNELRKFTGLFFGILFLMGGVVVFALSGIMFLARMIHLWFLVIIMPLAWAAFILPSTRKHFTAWWSHFLRWTFFFPAFSFFLYLAIALVNRTDGILGTNSGIDNITVMGTVIGASVVPSGIGAMLPVMQSPQLMVQYLIAISFLFAALKASNALGIHGADFVQKATVGIYTGTGRFLRNRASGGIRQAAERSGLAARGRAIRSRLPRFVGGKRPEEIEAAQHKKYGEVQAPQSKNVAIASIKRGVEVADEKSIYSTLKAIENLADKNQLNDKTIDEVGGNVQNMLQAYAPLAAELGIDKKVYAARPDLIADDTDRRKRFEKMSTEGDFSKMDADVLKNPQMLRELSEVARPETLSKFSNAQLDALTEAMASDETPMADKKAIYENFKKVMDPKSIEALQRRHPKAGQHVSIEPEDSAIASKETKIDPASNTFITQDADGNDVTHDRAGERATEILANSSAEMIQTLSKNLDGFADNLDQALQRFDQAFDASGNTLLDAAKFSSGQLESIFKNMAGVKQRFALELNDRAKLDALILNAQKVGVLSDHIDALGKSNPAALAELNDAVSKRGMDTWGDDIRKILAANKNITKPKSTGEKSQNTGNQQGSTNPTP